VSSSARSAVAIRLGVWAENVPHVLRVALLLCALWPLRLQSSCRWSVVSSRLAGFSLEVLRPLWRNGFERVGQRSEIAARFVEPLAMAEKKRRKGEHGAGGGVIRYAAGCGGKKLKKC